MFSKEQLDADQAHGRARGSSALGSPARSRRLNSIVLSVLALPLHQRADSWTAWQSRATSRPGCAVGSTSCLTTNFGRLPAADAWLHEKRNE